MYRDWNNPKERKAAKEALTRTIGNAEQKRQEDLNRSFTWDDMKQIEAVLERQEEIIEEQEKKIEGQEERIAIMTEHGLWIPVEERLPEKCDFYLVRDFGEIKMNGKKIGLTKVMLFYPEEKQWEKHNEDVTHWMPLPEPPKEGEAE